MSKLKSKGKSRAESVAPGAAASALSHPGPVNLDPAEQQAVDGFLDLLARLIARAHLNPMLEAAAPAEAGSTENGVTGPDGNESPRKRRC